MTTAVKSAAIALIAAGALLCPTDLSSCGPFFTQAVFSFTRAPEHPIAETKELGILKPAYVRFSLYSAYRQLTSPFTPSEVRALTMAPTDVSVSPDEWLKAREKAPGLPAPAPIEVTLTRSTPTDYVQYTNCLSDAFHSAAVTLNARLANWNTTLVKDWVSAQDQVFANCKGTEPPQIPALASDPRLRADRDYQIAAAYFYANKLDDAETRFRQIAADKASPWSDLSDYLIARVQIRKSTLRNDPAAMNNAQTQLKAILGDASRKAVQPEALALLTFVHGRLDPEGRLAELGNLLIKPDANLGHDLRDYRFLFDKLENAGAVKPKDELTDWLYTFHNKNREHALTMWRSRHAVPWLLASVVSLQTSDTSGADAIQAAEDVRPDSPAYRTAAFHSIRLRMDANPEQARARLDGILKDSKLDLSDKNLFLAERMKVAANWGEFLKYAQRSPAGVGWGEGAEVPPDADPNSPLKDFNKGRTTLDADGALVLNEHTPLKLMAAAATDNTVSAALRNNIAAAAWTRAILLGDDAVAAKMTPLVAVLSATAPESDQDRRIFGAVLLMLNNPGLHPYADTGFGRETEINKIDNYRDNWWCSVGGAQGDRFSADFYRDRAELGELKELYPNSAPKAAFLSVADQAAGDADWKKLSSLPAAPTYLANAVVKYAQAHLDDPRVPEALALAVRATRFGCTDAATGKASKQAFDLLHAKFPRSAAAARTQFWYK